MAARRKSNGIIELCDHRFESLYLQFVFHGNPQNALDIAFEDNSTGVNLLDCLEQTTQKVFHKIQLRFIARLTTGHKSVESNNAAANLIPRVCFEQVLETKESCQTVSIRIFGSLVSSVMMWATWREGGAKTRLDSV